MAPNKIDRPAPGKQRRHADMALRGGRRSSLCVATSHIHHAIVRSDQLASRACDILEFGTGAASLQTCKPAMPVQTLEDPMKTIIASALAILSLMTSLTTPVSAALDSKQFWEQQDRSHY
jgi:hypothetical protein